MAAEQNDKACQIPLSSFIQWSRSLQATSLLPPGGQLGAGRGKGPVPGQNTALCWPSLEAAHIQTDSLILRVWG